MAKRSMDIAHPKYDPDLKPDEPAEKSFVKKSVPAPVNDMAPEITPEKRDVFWPVYLVGIVIVAVLAFFGVRAGAKLVDTWMDLKPSSVGTDTTTKEPATTESTTTTADTTTAEVAVTESAPAAAPAPEPAKPAIDKAALKIRVLNGGGVSGAGDAAKKVIEAAGFKVDSVGNAKKFSYETSYVYYPKDKKAEAELLSESIKDKYSITTEENEVAAGYDALVVIGKK